MRKDKSLPGAGKWEHTCLAYFEGEGLRYLSPEELKDPIIQRQIELLSAGFVELEKNRPAVYSDTFDIGIAGDELRGAISLPDGWRIIPDLGTHNLVVTNGTHEFCVTKECLLNWPLDKVSSGVTEIIDSILFRSAPPN